MNYTAWPRRIIYPIVLTAFAGTMVWYDYSRMISDLAEARSTLMQSRNESIIDRKERAAQFSDHAMSVYANGKLINSVKLPTLSSVNYDTTVGKNMIVFTAGGTGPYNKKVHGGDITFKSWLGFTKSLWVNCTGYVVEGLMPTNK